MAKIILNNIEYFIDKSVLASATASLKSHLTTVMNGTGAVINLDGVAYNVDSAKLATAMNDFTSHLGTVAGSGSKVVVNGIEYSLDSTKMSDAVSQLETVLGDLSVGGDSGTTVINLYYFYGGGCATYTYDGDVNVTWGTNSDAPSGKGILYFNGNEIYNIGVEDLEGLSVSNDYSVTGDNDIPYGTNATLKAGNTYTFYTYVTSELTGTEQGGGIDGIEKEETSGEITTVTIYGANGTLRGKLTTTDAEPKLYWTCNDSGEIYLSGAEKPDAIDYHEAFGRIDVSIAATPPAGLSVANDYNLTSEGDLIWNNGNGGFSIFGDGLAATLIAGRTYTYYVYSNDDLQ